MQFPKITLLWVIPTMTSIRFVTGKSPGILSDISSGILSGISSGILSGISSAICSGISSGTLSGISSGILSGKSSGVLSGKHSGTLSGIPSGILSDILSGIPSGFYLAYLLAFYLANILALYLAYLLAFFLTCYLAFYLAYLLAFYLAVEVQRCSLSSEGPRLRSSGAHWARTVPGWGPAVPTELRRSQVEVQRCPLRSDACGWGPAVPTQSGSRQLRSSSAHCVRKLAKSLAKSWQGGSEHGSGGRGGTSLSLTLNKGTELPPPADQEMNTKSILNQWILNQY